MSPMDLIAPLVTNLQIIDVPKDPKKTVLIFLVLDKPVEPTTGGKSVDNIVLKASHTPVIKNSHSSIGVAMGSYCSSLW